MNSNSVNKYIYGIDYLRVFFCIGVVSWHMNVGIVGQFNIFNYLFGFNILLMAVPTFLMISNFLFLYKGGDIVRLKNNLKKILLLFLFWALVVHLLDGHYSFFTSLPPDNIKKLYKIVTGGNFGVYYFLISLIITQVLTFYLQKINNKFLAAGVVISLIFTYLLSLCAKLTGKTDLIAYYNPLNFLAVPFLSVLLNRLYLYQTKKTALYSLLLFLVAIPLIILEVLTLNSKVFPQDHGFYVPEYARPSIYVIGTALILISFSVANVPPMIIRYISKNSLGIYLIHSYFTGITVYLLSPFIHVLPLPVINVLGVTTCLILVLSVIQLYKMFLKSELLFGH
jgi:hypothetical protein